MSQGNGNTPTTSELDFASVSEDDFRDFLMEKVKNHACPCCLTNNWAILSAPNMNFGILAIPKNGGFSMPPPTIPVMGIACNACGYIRQHALGKIAQWKAAKKAKV